MRILLFISAFLAALTGGGAHARVAGPVAEVSVSCATRAERLTGVAASVAQPAFGHLDRVNFAGPRAVQAPVGRTPLYADRLLI